MNEFRVTDAVKRFSIINVSRGNAILIINLVALVSFFGYFNIVFSQYYIFTSFIYTITFLLYSQQTQRNEWKKNERMKKTTSLTT